MFFLIDLDGSLMEVIRKIRVKFHKSLEDNYTDIDFELGPDAFFFRDALKDEQNYRGILAQAENNWGYPCNFNVKLTENEADLLVKGLAHLHGYQAKTKVFADKRKDVVFRVSRVFYFGDEEDKIAIYRAILRELQAIAILKEYTFNELFYVHPLINIFHVNGNLEVITRSFYYHGSDLNSSLFGDMLSKDLFETTRKKLDLNSKRKLLAVLFYLTLESLRAVHDVSMLHQDVKPGNIVFSTRAMDFVLIDYDNSLAVTKEEKEQGVMSTDLCRPTILPLCQMWQMGQMDKENVDYAHCKVSFDLDVHCLLLTIIKIVGKVNNPERRFEHENFQIDYDKGLAQIQDEFSHFVLKGYFLEDQMEHGDQELVSFMNEVFRFEPSNDFWQLIDIPTLQDHSFFQNYQINSRKQADEMLLGYISPVLCNLHYIYSKITAYSRKDEGVKYAIQSHTKTFVKFLIDLKYPIYENLNEIDSKLYVFSGKLEINKLIGNDNDLQYFFLWHSISKFFLSFMDQYIYDESFYAQERFIISWNMERDQINIGFLKKEKSLKSLRDVIIQFKKQENQDPDECMIFLIYLGYQIGQLLRNFYKKRRGIYINSINYRDLAINKNGEIKIFDPFACSYNFHPEIDSFYDAIIYFSIMHLFGDYENWISLSKDLQGIKTPDMLYSYLEKKTGSIFNSVQEVWDQILKFNFIDFSD